MIYGFVWRGMGWYMVWPDGLTRIWYGLVGIAWHMVWSIGHGMVYGVVWRAWHGIWYGIVEHRMIFVLVWRGVAWYM